jgi:hypothetical protein
LPGRKLAVYDHSLRMSAFRVRYGYTDDPQEIEQRMDELAREYHEIHDPEIPEEIFELARRLREMDH